MERLRLEDRELFRFVSAETGTNMYALLDYEKALIIDPHPSDELTRLLNETIARACTILLTHEHADHSWGIRSLEDLCQTCLICQRHCADCIADKKNDTAAFVRAMLSIQDSRQGTNRAEDFLKRYKPHSYKADIVFDQEYFLDWGQERFVLTHTPGHSPGSCCIVWNKAAVFTGDSLMRDEAVITRIPGGSAKDYQSITAPFLNSLDRDLVALPGHGPYFRLRDLAS